jgi:hypothetical protein
MFAIRTDGDAGHFESVCRMRGTCAYNGQYTPDTYDHDDHRATGA